LLTKLFLICKKDLGEFLLIKRDLTDAYLTQIGFKLAEGTDREMDKSQNSNSVIAMNT